MAPRRAQHKYALQPHPPVLCIRQYRWVGLGGWGLVANVLPGLVSRAWIWMGGAGVLGMGCQWLAGLVSRVCL